MRSKWARPLLGALVLVPLAVMSPSVVAGAAVTSAAGGACTGLLAGVSVMTGSDQVAKVGTAYSVPLEVKVVDTGGCPLAGENVQFLTPDTAATAYFAGAATVATVATGSDGTATAPTLTANAVSGSFDVVASIGPFSADFELTNTTAGAASSLSVSAGNDQSAGPGDSFASPLQVLVMDSYGDPVAGAAVVFTAVTTDGAAATFAGGGATATVQSDASGLAVSPLLTAGDVTGAFTVTASVSGATSTATFDLTVLSGTPDAIAAGVGISQSAELGTDFGVPLAVTVTDADGNPVVGAMVTFSAPASGASGVFAGWGATALVATGTEGVATAPDFSAGLHTGGYVVTASVAGVTGPATFAMVNEPRSAASVPGPDGSYWLVTSTGRVLASGNVAHYATVAGKPAAPVVGMASAPGGKGYWLVTSKGVVYAAGTAVKYPPASAQRPGPKPIVGIAATPDGKGYWLVASNGAIYNYGDAASYGSPAGLHLTKPIVAMATTPDGKGYWLVASDGGIFNYGDAAYYGSTGKIHLTKPIVGIAAAPAGNGYVLVASDGGVFVFGHATFYGSGTGLSPKPVVGIVATPDGAGYWIISANGTAAGFGDAGAQGSPATKQVVGGAA